MLQIIMGQWWSSLGLLVCMSAIPALTKLAFNLDFCCRSLDKFLFFFVFLQALSDCQSRERAALRNLCRKAPSVFSPGLSVAVVSVSDRR